MQSPLCKPRFCPLWSMGVSLWLHCKPIPVMKTGFSLCTFPNREKPVFITGIPANVNRIFPVWEKYTGKTLFWSCTGPVRDCNVELWQQLRCWLVGLVGWLGKMRLGRVWWGLMGSGEAIGRA